VTVLAALLVTVRPQPPQPTQGVHLSNSSDILFPAVVSQCEPVLIYYNTTGRTEFYPVLIFTQVHVVGDTYRYQDLISFSVPIGVGYFEWLCDIPAGYGFIVRGRRNQHYSIVQPGSSSFCLRNITTTYSYAEYFTDAFLSYTANPPVTSSPRIGSTILATCVFCLTLLIYPTLTGTHHWPA
jgi:hypothetical protein